MSKPAVFVVNEKGGTGKSFFSRAWVDLARSRGKRVAVFDADAKVGTMLRAFGTRTNGTRDKVQDPLVGVSPFNIMNADEQEVLLNAADAGANAILIDTPAGSMDEFERLLGSGVDLFREYRSAGYIPTLVFVLDTDSASVQSVMKAIRRYKSEVGYLVVKNLHHDPSGQFERFAKAASETAEKVGAQVIALPVLRKQTVERMNALDVGRFSDVVKSPDASLTDRVAVRGWLAALDAALAPTALSIEGIE